MNAVELALIGLWARANWTDVAHACRTGTVRKPDYTGGSLRGHPVLTRAAGWIADGRSIRAFTHRCPWPGDAKTFEEVTTVEYTVKWGRVNAWLWEDGGWSDADRDAMRHALHDYYAVYPQRDDEEWEPAAGEAEVRERAARYNTRLAGPDGDLMRDARARALALIGSHLAPAPALF